ncbi:hypothetical protein N7533_012556 [Penicillium manginii]|uniref:uncharacterized protein n=1 Tax=Penicillium manginii TaxID=203109 RepID=UPI0025495CB5|nr:uncharacterized protein N7533_012556 [Penicillium manginii]KAJ5739772.1 hypothetical protein N7533_012556 [Penicillium manginii]
MASSARTMQQSPFDESRMRTPRIGECNSPTSGGNQSRRYLSPGRLKAVGFEGQQLTATAADVKLQEQNEAIWTSIIWRMLSIILRLFITADTFGLCHHSRQRDEDTVGEGTPIVASDL